MYLRIIVYRLIVVFILLPFVYCQLLSQAVFPYCQGNLYGLVSTSGTIILPPKYDKIKLAEHPANAALFVIYHQGHYGLIDKAGKEIFPPVLSNMEYQGTGFAWYYEDKQNKKRLHVYSSKYQKEIFVADSLRLIEISGTKMFFAEIFDGYKGHDMLIDESGKIVVPNVQGEVSIEFEDYDCPLIAIGRIGNRTFYDCNGNKGSFAEYFKNSRGGNDYQDISEDFVALQTENKESAKDTAGLPPDVVIVKEVKQDKKVVSLIARKNDMYGLLSPSGEVLAAFRYTYLGNSFDYIEANVNAERGLLTKTGQLILPIKFKYIDTSPHEFFGYIRVHTINNYCGFADKNGNLFLPPEAMPK